MIDGRGQARIADFGIATVRGKLEDGGREPGTPAYMAPELLKGGRPSVRSDLYSLGMVLYEMVSGREPFAGKPPTDPSREMAPARLSEAVCDVDERLEGVILRCLEPDSKRRPESAYAIAAALPGSDPLRLALAAGETPSPSMVVAAISGPLPRLGVAACWLATSVLALFLVVLLADRAFLLPQAGLTKPPAVLADKAEHAIRALGYEPAVQRSRQELVINRELLAHVMASNPAVTHGRYSATRPRRRYASGTCAEADRPCCLCSLVSRRGEKSRAWSRRSSRWVWTDGGVWSGSQQSPISGNLQTPPRVP